MAVCLFHWSVNTSYLRVQRCCARSQYPAVYGQLGPSTYRWPEQQSHRDVTIIYVYATSDMLRRSENVLYYCACKQHRLSLSCELFPASLQHSSLSSPAASGQRYHYTTQQTLTLISSWASNRDARWFYRKKPTVILYFPRIMFHLCGRRGPADPHQFLGTDTSNSRRPRDCLFRHLNTALVLPPPSITLSSFWPTRPCWQLLGSVRVCESKEKE